MKLTTEQQKLIEDNLPWCYVCFKKYNIFGEDAQQTLLERLCAYIHLYDSSRGSITTFIDTVIATGRCHLYKYDNAQIRRADKEALSLSKVLFENDDDVFTIEDTLEALEDGFDTVENRILIDNIYKNLNLDKTITKRNLEIFFAYLDCGSFKFVGELYGMTIEAVRHHYYKVEKAINDHKLYDNKIATQFEKKPKVKSKLIITKKPKKRKDKTIIANNAPAAEKNSDIKLLPSNSICEWLLDGVIWKSKNSIKID